MSKTNVKGRIIFLAGFPRSGTTWFANLLNAHSNIIYRHEIFGRNHYIFGNDLFGAIKHHNGLTDDELSVAINHISSARVDTDKPPFFSKPIGLLKYKRFHHYAWLATKALPFLAPLYKSLFTVKNLDDFSFLIKETRSTVNMDSIIAGLRPVAVLFLVRQPHGAIASHIKGIQRGTMEKTALEKKLKWYRHNKDVAYIKEIGLSEEGLNEVTDAEFFALQWRVYHEDLIAYAQTFSNTRFFSYDSFAASPKDSVDELFSFLSLETDEEVSKFIDESSGKEKVGVAQRDASDEYYSVYRSASFDPQSWKSTLTSVDIALIDKHTTVTYNLLKERM